MLNFNHCRLFDNKSYLYIHIKYLRFDFVGFYRISIIVHYLMINSLYTYILNTSDSVWLGYWNFNRCRLFNDKSFLYIPIKYLRFGLVGFYGISTIVGYSMTSLLYIYIYIVIHRQICFVLSELISVARQYLPVAGIETQLTQMPSQSF